MKNPLILILIILPFSVWSQAEKADTSKRPCASMPGKPFGDIRSRPIGPAGGSIRSADNQLELIFPAGALKQETHIGIQAVTNSLSADSSTGAYRLEPSGIEFAKPVMLVMHYANKENGFQKGIATQDKDGRWIGLKGTKTDTLSQTVTGILSHFSDWALFNHYELVPKEASLFTGQSQLLEIRHLTWEAEQAAGGAVQFGVPLITEKVIIDKWTVNGIEGGNSETGMIAEGGQRWGIYVAPSQLPSVNPVTVTAYFKGVFFDVSGNRFKYFFLNSLITIKERGYRFTYVHKNFAGCFHTIDSSTCIIRFDNKTVTLTDVVNHKPWSDWDPCTKCSHSYTNKETFKANVEIWGMAGAKVTPPADATSMTDVYITLLPAMGNTPASEQQCPKSPKIITPSFALPADPKYIHFEARGDDVIVHYMGISGRQVISKKVKHEETVIRVERL